MLYEEHIGAPNIVTVCGRRGHSRMKKSEVEAAAGGRVLRDPGPTAADFEFNFVHTPNFELIGSNLERPIFRISN